MAKGETYEEFVAKFKKNAPKTPDDCYTPQPVYEVVKEYALKLAGLTEETCTPVRPFYPGGDYRNYDYPADAYVIDNPPFSILSEIRQFYMEKGIKYFLFAPHKTIFSCMNSCKDTRIVMKAVIIYDSGVSIATSFVTNVLGKDILIKTAPELLTALRRTVALTKGNKNNVLGVKNEYPRNMFPFQKINAVMYADFHIKRSECKTINKFKMRSECETGNKIKAPFGRFALIIPDSVADRYEAAVASVPKDAGKNVYYFTPEQEEILKQLNEKHK